MQHIHDKNTPQFKTTMGSKDNIIDRYLATNPSTKESDRRLKFLLKCIQNLSAEQLDAEQLDAKQLDAKQLDAEQSDAEHFSCAADGNHKPSRLVPQVVLRRQGLVPVDTLVRLHSLFKSEQRGLHEVFSGLDPNDPNAMLIYCVLSALCAE